MAGTVLTYDPEQIQVIVGGTLVGGFAEDEFVEVERDVDSYTKYVGCGGEVARILNANRSGRVTLRLMQSSPSNDELSLLEELGEIAVLAGVGVGIGAVPLLIRDRGGSTLFTAVFCWPKRFPKVIWKKEVEVREWVLDTSTLYGFVGGTSS